MSNLITKLSAGVIAVILALPVNAQSELTADSVVATVNGTDITLAHVLMFRAGLPEQYQQAPNDVLWEGIIEQLVQQEVLSQQDNAVETRRVKAALDNERRTLLASEAVGAIVDQEVTEASIQEAYEARFAGGDAETEFNASHILVESEEEAAALVQELADGADFATLARENSTGPSGPNGGSLGWFGPGMMVPAFQAAVEALEAGQVSEPVQTQFGWHVIILNETRIKEAPAFETVREDLQNELSQMAVSQKLDELMRNSVVTRMSKDDVDTAIVSNFDLLED